MIKYSEWIQGTSQYNHGTKLNADKNKFKHTKTENKRWYNVYDHTCCKVEWSNTTRKLKFYDPQVITTKLNQNVCAIRCIFFFKLGWAVFFHTHSHSQHVWEGLDIKKTEAPNCTDEHILVTKCGSFFCKTEKGQTFPQCRPSALYPREHACKFGDAPQHVTKHARSTPWLLNREKTNASTR